MCGGLQEICDDGVKQGMQLVIKIFKLHKCGASYSEIAEECSIPMEQVKTILEDDAA